MSGLQLWLSEFVHDTKLHAVVYLLAADIVFGCWAALKKGTFRLSYFADFARRDVLGKVLPWFGFYAMAIVAGHVNLPVIPVDFGDLAGAAYVAVVAALSGSIVSSIAAISPTVASKLPGAVKQPEVEGPPPAA